MRLTVIMRKVGRETSNCSTTIKSLRHKDVQLDDIIFIDKLSDMNYGKIKSDWWIVLHDDEKIEDRLLEAMIIGSESENYDVFSFYKVDCDGKITICPRMFRKHVRIEQDRLYPILPVKMETLLDGWVMENDRTKDERTKIKDLVLFDG